LRWRLSPTYAVVEDRQQQKASPRQCDQATIAKTERRGGATSITNATVVISWIPTQPKLTCSWEYPLYFSPIHFAIDKLLDIRIIAKLRPANTTEGEGRRRETS
jgi:hypothetical protein